MRNGDNHLVDNGIAYVSYNTYPGWHTMEEVRQLMLFANRGQEIQMLCHPLQLLPYFPERRTAIHVTQGTGTAGGRTEEKRTRGKPLLHTFYLYQSTI